MNQVNVNKSIVIVQGCDKLGANEWYDTYGGGTGTLTSSTNINISYRPRCSYVDWQVIEFLLIFR